MIDKGYFRNKVFYFLVCDICGEVSVAFNTYQDAVEGKGELGWKSCKTISGWDDMCKECGEGEK